MTLAERNEVRRLVCELSVEYEAGRDPKRVHDRIDEFLRGTTVGEDDDRNPSSDV